MLCDDCENGDHENCDGSAWDEEREWVACECTNTMHAEDLERAEKARQSWGRLSQ